ncbi:sensor histidine kinase [Chondromyces crocatus]|uniref:histidine kinase n=1 Tax=Chondromyces crocatus TaxID=52 RepID=A0A0K1EAE3_CHOCO|nr:HAMP domain-containing sensor histidine kinase [Chondromyces crocatus]AKT37851.1 uncharacterized protein CMC5_019940 [Chondromyces crocatus]
MTAQDPTLDAIERRLGFIPPFFVAAKHDPQLLAGLWRTTVDAYLDNPLPPVFKEKVGALLGRYCSIKYCLICHACTLVPLGVTSRDIFGFLQSPIPDDTALRDAMTQLQGMPPSTIAALSEPQEQAIHTLCCAVYLGGPAAEVARPLLRQVITRPDYDWLLLFVAYNRSCHEWVTAHPEVSYELDQRYLGNIDPLMAHAPPGADLLRLPQPDWLSAQYDHFAQTAHERDEEHPRLAELAARRLQEVLTSLRANLDTALRDASERQQLVDEATRAATLSQELLAIVSHDLRNPLHAINMDATLLTRLAPGNPDVLRAATRIRSSIQRSHRLIYDLLDFSQARAGGGLLIHPRPTLLHDLLRQGVEEIQTAHPDRRIVLNCEGNDTVACDPERIAQVISNLLSNAIIHSPGDSTITAETHADDDLIALRIHNLNRNGPIPDELRPSLFEPFKRGVNRELSATRSVGLGLYIVDQIVKGHGGTIGVHSDAAGTTFTVQLQRELHLAPRSPVPTASVTFAVL